MLATSGTINLPDQLHTSFEVPLSVTVPAGAREMVVEVFRSNYDAVFYIGSNTAPETGPSYFSAIACGVPEPVPADYVERPNMHIVLNVNGHCVGSQPTPSPRPSVTPRVRPTPRPRPAPGR